MELFDVQYVYESHEEANGLVGKTVFIADGIKELATRVNNNKTCYAATLVNVEDSDYPFKPESGLRYKYAYYDPNYDVKVAFKSGDSIQWKDRDVEEWHLYGAEDAPDDWNMCEWRVAPPVEQKFEIGDLVCVIGKAIVGMVTAIDKDKRRLPNEYYVGDSWYEAGELELL